MRFKGLSVVLCSLLSLLAQVGMTDLNDAAAQVQDTTKIYRLEEVVVTATRFPISLREAPSNVSVVTSREIEEAHAYRLGEALKLSPGVGITDYGYFGNAMSMGLRGSPSQQVLILLDGRPINNPQSGGLNLSNVSLEDVERVEVLRGGASALYGRDALGGVVNLITKPTPAGKPYTRIRMERGGHGFGLNRFQFGTRIGQNAGLFLSGGRDDSDGYRINSDYESWWGSAKLDWLFHPDWRLTLSGRRYDGELGVPGPLLSPSPKARQDDLRYDIDVGLEGDLKGNPLQLRLYHSRLKRHYRNPSTDKDDTHRPYTYGVDLQQSVSLAEAHRITFGGNLERNRVKSTAYGESHSAYLGALFFQDQLRLMDVLGLQIGGRLDYHSVYGTEISPNLGFSFTLTPQVRLFAGGKGNFRAPSFDDLYWYQPPFMYGNEDLKPEKGQSYELGGKVANDRLLCSINLFHREVKDLIQWVEYEPWKWRAENKASTEFNGTELEFVFRPFNACQMGMFHTFLYEAKDKDSGERLTYRPKHQWTGYFQYAENFIHDQVGLKLRLEAEYTGSRRYSSTEELPDVQVFNLDASFRLLDFTVYYVIDNLFDRDYELMKGYPMPRRTHRWGFSWEFWG